MSDGAFLVLLLSAGFIGAFGVAIKHFGMVQLIAGYDADRVTDEAGLAAFVGTNLLYVAALTLLVAVAEYAEPFAGAELRWPVFVAGVFGLTARIVLGSRRYERPA